MAKTRKAFFLPSEKTSLINACDHTTNRFIITRQKPQLKKGWNEHPTTPEDVR